MEPWKHWGFKHHRLERRMPRGAPRNPRNGFQPGSAPRPKGGSARGRTGKIWRRGSRPTNTAGPPWSCTPPGPERDTVETQGGTASKKEALSESPARTRTRTLGLAQVEQRKSRTARRQQETASAQATVPGSRENAGPTADDGTGRSPNAEAGTHDGGDDAWHVTGQRL
jgi:hypothetical protein